MTDADVYPYQKGGPVRPSCVVCGCPPTAMVVGGDVSGSVCGHCHDDAPMERPESPDIDWPDWLQEAERV